MNRGIPLHPLCSFGSCIGKNLYFLNLSSQERCPCITHDETGGVEI